MNKQVRQEYAYAFIGYRLAPRKSQAIALAKAGAVLMGLPMPKHTLPK